MFITVVHLAVKPSLAVHQSVQVDAPLLSSSHCMVTASTAAIFGEDNGAEQ